MALGIVSIWYGNLVAMFAVLFLTGAQSALLSTEKFGIIQEIVPRKRLSVANGLAGLVTLIAVIAGTVAGNALYTLSQTNGLMIAATALLSVAGLGIVAAVMIAPVRPANPGIAFRFGGIS